MWYPSNHFGLFGDMCNVEIADRNCYPLEEANVEFLSFYFAAF